MADAPGHQQADPRGGPLRRGRLGLLAGLAPDEALLPHRPAHRDRRGHPRHRRAGPQLRRDRQEAHTRAASVTVSVGGFVPKPFTPFQWFGQNTGRGAAAQDQPAARRRSAASKGVQLKWHDPKATMVEGIVSRGDRRLGPVIEDVWRARRHVPGVVASTSTSSCGSTPWPATGSSVDWYVHRHRTEDEVLPWDHLSAGLHKDFLWQDWRDALDEVGLEDCRWTPCYDCGACTGYGIEHVVASADPAGRRQPGHRPGPRSRIPVGARRPSRPRRSCSVPSRPRSCRGPSDAGPLPVLASSARSASPATATSPASGSGPCAAPSCPSPSPRASRPGPRCTSAWPCRPATSRWASTSTSTSASPSATELDLDALPELLTAAAARRASTSQAVAVIDRQPRRRSSRPSPAARGASRSSASTPVDAVAAVDRAAGRRRDLGHPAAQGQRRHRRHPPVHPAAAVIGAVPACVAEAPGRHPGRQSLDAELATQPRGLRPAELLAALGISRSPRDGSAEPTNGSRSTAPGRSPFLPARRRRRTPRRVRHEKGTPHDRSGRRRPRGRPAHRPPAGRRAHARSHIVDARRPRHRQGGRTGVERPGPTARPTAPGDSRRSANRRRRGSRGGRSRTRPEADGADGTESADGADRRPTLATPQASPRPRPATAGDAADPASAADLGRPRGRGDGPATGNPDELPERIVEGKPKSAEAAEKALVRAPQIGDTRPAPAERGRRRPRPTKPRRRASAGAAVEAAAAAAPERRRRRTTADAAQAVATADGPRPTVAAAARAAGAVGGKGSGNGGGGGAGGGRTAKRNAPKPVDGDPRRRPDRARRRRPRSAGAASARAGRSAATS